MQLRGTGRGRPATARLIDRAILSDAKYEPHVIATAMITAMPTMLVAASGEVVGDESDQNDEHEEPDDQEPRLADVR